MELVRGRQFIAFGIVVAALLTACTEPRPPRPVSTLTPAGGTTSGGDAVAPAPGVRTGKSYLFRVDSPPVAVRPASKKLADLVANIDGLGTAGLPSTRGAAAVILVEDSPGTPWGKLLSEAQGKIFPAFAADQSMGSWLILVSDVVIRDQKDPIAPTAYRWERQDVRAYVSCGIPASGASD
ncbi:MAG TPA: hypothetical protein VGR13_08770, partial [Actinomycetota bacterium]|nr:hypothetical protein [Actinomycetota bacterium]